MDLTLGSFFFLPVVQCTEVCVFVLVSVCVAGSFSIQECVCLCVPACGLSTGKVRVRVPACCLVYMFVCVSVFANRCIVKFIVCACLCAHTVCGCVLWVCECLSF